MTFCRDRRSGRFDLSVMAAGAIAVLLMTSAASAATIANRGDKEVKLTITEDASVKDEVLPVGKVVDGVCQKSCIIRLNDSVNDEYELDGSESVSVERGFLYYDSPANGGAPPVGSASGQQERK
jgi:long-subunit acyl-CoA synthetase (AMP-forming)